jgi:hypothetical protein
MVDAGNVTHRSKFRPIRIDTDEPLILATERCVQTGEHVLCDALHSNWGGRGDLTLLLPRG